MTRIRLTPDDIAARAADEQYQRHRAELDQAALDELMDCRYRESFAAAWYAETLKLRAKEELSVGDDA